MSIQQCLFLLPTSGGESYWTTDITLPANTDSTNSENEVWDFALDSGGNIYVAGTRDDNSGPMNAYILKLHKNGTLEASTEDSSGSIIGIPYGIAVDSNDDVYTYMGYGRIVKYNSNLNTQYYKRESEWGGGQTFGEGANGNGSLFSNGTSITTYGTYSSYKLGLTFDGSTGDISSGGYTQINGGNQAILMYYGANKPPGTSTIYLSGYSTGGNINGSLAYWVVATLGYGLSPVYKFYSGVSNASAWAVTRDSSGKMYVAGQMNNVPTITKIDSYNNYLTNQGTAWWRKMNTSGRYNDLTADNFGNVYGAIGGSIVKYNSSGTLLWSKAIAPNIEKIEIIDSILYAIGTIGPTSLKVCKLPITGEGLNDAGLTDTSFNYLNQGGTSGAATQSDLGSTQNGAVIWSGWVSSNLSTSSSSPTFTQGSIDNISVPYGEAEFTTPGTYSWIAPAGVTAVSVVAVGAGGNSYTGAPGGGGGGGLGWKNNIPVTPGQSYTVVVGANVDNQDGGDSYFINTSTVKGGGGQKGKLENQGGTGGTGGNYVGSGGGNGGYGGNQYASGGNYGGAGGGGGAGGYSGSGGDGGNGTVSNGSGDPGSSGSGGAGGGGCGATWEGGSGGGVRLYGEGASGVGGGWDGSNPAQFTYGYAGYGGSGAEPQTDTTTPTYTNSFGAGSGGGDASDGSGGTGEGHGGSGGGVRIIWGAGRGFPSTNTGDE